MRARQMVLVNIIVILVILGLAAGGYWFFYNRAHYVSDSDAYVGVPSQDIVSVAAGKVTQWNVQDGQTVTKGQVLGIEQLPTGQSANLTTALSGQVLQTDTVVGEVVNAGDLLAVVANLGAEYIVANVPETAIRHVATGQSVDVYLDAFPGQTFAGTVTNIGPESAAMDSLFPTAQSASNFTKEVQRVPVYISLASKQGKIILPNMNASVRIHR